MLNNNIMNVREHKEKIKQSILEYLSNMEEIKRELRERVLLF